MNALSMIHIKRAGARPHTDAELQWFIQEYASNEVPDYQMSAWLMAVCWKGMTPEETATLCQCMVASGAKLEWHNHDTIPAAVPQNTPRISLVDKHSTGGVGDKISLILAPLVATLGGYVPMMAGRGLGHTGGTIDKLESIPGYQTTLSIDEFQTIVRSDVQCSIVAASSEMCVADRKLYGLRDVTGTVSSIPLQTASIMCKKIAEHPDSLVLDVKYGTASFQSSAEEATILAQSMIATGEANGLSPVTCVLTHMDGVIGTSVGNWLEVAESLQLLKYGKATPDLMALVVIEAALMLHQTKEYTSQPWNEVVELVHTTLVSGKAYERFEAMVAAHGGDVSLLRQFDQPGVYPHTPQHVRDVVATQSGYLSKVNGRMVGDLCVLLGAGRLKADDPVDPIAGMHFHIQVGDAVIAGETIIARVQTNASREVLNRVCTQLQEEAIDYSSTPIDVPFVVSHKVTSARGVEDFVVPMCLS